MRQTLFHIPHSIGPLPVFGFGWVMILWTLASVGFLVWMIRKQGWNRDTMNFLPVIGIVWLAAVALLPMLEEMQNEVALGVPIRGYGVMLLLGVVAGVGFSAYLARRMGLDPEFISSLAFVLFICAIVGARAFYVIEYWEQFSHVYDKSLGTFRPASWGELLAGIVNVTQGGLVVYGSLIGGLVGGLVFLWQRKLPVLAIADIVAPSMVLGLALGRIGCLLNGCCFGGVCDYPWAIQFPGEPKESPPYQQQREEGLLSGITVGENEAGLPTIAAIDLDGGAAGKGLEVGDVILRINGQPVYTASAAQRELIFAQGEIVMEVNTGRAASWPVPTWSKPIHPTQIYSSINAFLIFLLLWAWYPFRKHDGEVMALLLTIYPLTRFLEEIIRTDEPGQWGTELSISQWVSMVLLAGVALLWVYILRGPTELALPPQRSKTAAG